MHPLPYFIIEHDRAQCSCSSLRFSFLCWLTVRFSVRSVVSTFQPASDDEKEEEEEEQPKQSKKKRKANADADNNDTAEPSSKKKKAKSPSSSASSAAAPSSSKGVAASTAVPPPRQQESPPEDDFGFTRASGSRGGVKRTEEGFKIYAIDDLRMGLSKNTPLCPIDCECCF